MYDPGEDVGARDTPSIRGQKKETPDRSLTAPLGSYMSGERPILDLSRTVGCTS